jgi:hypothetical protein
MNKQENLTKIVEGLKRQSLLIGPEGYRGNTDYEKAIIALNLGIQTHESDLKTFLQIGVDHGDFSQKSAERVLRNWET